MEKQRALRVRLRRQEAILRRILRLDLPWLGNLRLYRLCAFQPQRQPPALLIRDREEVLLPGHDASHCQHRSFADQRAIPLPEPRVDLLPFPAPPGVNLNRALEGRILPGADGVSFGESGAEGGVFRGDYAGIRCRHCVHYDFSFLSRRFHTDFMLLEFRLSWLLTQSISCAHSKTRGTD